MNNNIKVTVAIVLPGSTAHQVGEKKNVLLFKKKDLFPDYKGKDGDKIVRKRITRIPVIEYIPCMKNIKMTVDAYEYMISDECPEWTRRNIWSKLNRKQKLEAHLQRTCDHFGGLSFTYTILDD